jgi:hypothetical protein
VTEFWRPDAVAICVPVRNEATLLPRLLDALSVQRAGVALMLCIAFDGCSDGSEAIVTQRARSLPFTVITSVTPVGDEPNAGRARREALALGARSADQPRLALLSTDADSVPAPDWVAATVSALASADVVVGRIMRDSTFQDAAQDRLEIYYDNLFALRRRIDPVPWEAPHTHHYTGGANMAFRAAAYAALGGFEPRGAGEDAAIVDAAHRAGMRVRRDRSVAVETSSRRVGRAVGGLADHLRKIASDQSLDKIRVSHPEDAAWQYRGHALARRVFDHLSDHAAVAALARQIDVDISRLMDIAAASPNAEAFATRLVPGAPGREKLIGLVEAEQALAALARADLATAA